VFDVSGKMITTLVEEIQNPGKYSVNFSSEGLSSGIYFYKLEAGSYSDTKKMIFLK
jgi:hypothetical protein